MRFILRKILTAISFAISRFFVSEIVPYFKCVICSPSNLLASFMVVAMISLLYTDPGY